MGHSSGRDRGQHYHSRTAQRRLDQLERDAEFREDPLPRMRECEAIKTDVKGSYPTVANAWYWCAVQTVQGPPIEGQPAALVATGQHIWVFNLGNLAPGIGEPEIAQMTEGGYYTMKFDG